VALDSSLVSELRAAAVVSLVWMRMQRPIEDGMRLSEVIELLLTWAEHEGPEGESYKLLTLLQERGMLELGDPTGQTSGDRDTS
jgi:hypothetical protein